MKNTRLIFNEKYLTIKALFYGKTISLEKINVNKIRNLNLYNNKEYDVKGRTSGISFPNYHAGWMKLNNGNKSLVFLTDKTNVILIPTYDYDILFSTKDFDKIKKLLSKTKH